MSAQVCYKGTIPGKRSFISIGKMQFFQRFINTGSFHVQVTPSEPLAFETNFEEEQGGEKLKLTYYAY